MTITKELWALLDMDGSLADFETRMHERLRTMSAPEETFIPDPEDFEKVPPWIKERQRAIKKERGFWRTLDPIPFGMDLYQAFGRWGYQRMVLTKAPWKNHPAWTEKVQWCAEHIPDVEQVTITTHNKGLHFGDVLYDDYLPYIRAWLNRHPTGKVLMLDSPYNKGVTHPQVLRCLRLPFEEQESEIKCFLEVM